MGIPDRVQTSNRKPSRLENNCLVLLPNNTSPFDTPLDMFVHHWNTRATMHPCLQDTVTTTTTTRRRTMFLVILDRGHNPNTRVNDGWWQRTRDSFRLSNSNNTRQVDMPLDKHSCLPRRNKWRANWTAPSECAWHCCPTRHDIFDTPNKRWDCRQNTNPPLDDRPECRHSTWQAHTLDDKTSNHANKHCRSNPSLMEMAKHVMRMLVDWWWWRVCWAPRQRQVPQ